MKIGRFFSLGNGRVGQYLSPRVLVVRTPFQKTLPDGKIREFCCFGFENLSQAQKFARSLANLGLRYQLRVSQLLADCPYEVVLKEHANLAQTLAYWDRRDRTQLTPWATPKTSYRSKPSAPAISGNLATPSAA